MRKYLIELLVLTGLIGKQAASLTINTENVSISNYASFATGITLSTLVEVSANSPQYPCLSSTANVASSVYSMIYYYY